MKQQTKNNKIKWKYLSKEKVKFISYEFVFKDGKRKIKRIRFNNNPKKLQGGCGGPQGIKIDNLFFKFKTDDEKNALLWHELYHCRFTFILKQLGLEIKYCLGDKQSFWEEEYNADRYSALQNNIIDCLTCLGTIKEIYEENSSLYNSKTHPPIEERIKKIEALKNKDETTK